MWGSSCSTSRSGAASGRPLHGGAADERLVEVDPRASGASRSSSSLVPTQVRTSNARVCGVELEDRSAVGVGEAHRLGDDRRQHLVEVAARADGMADLPKRPQLVDRAREVAPALLELLEELHVLDRDRALRGEGGGEGDRLLVELLDLVAPQRDDAEDALVDKHRHAQQGADAAQLAGTVPLVVGVGDARPGSGRCGAPTRRGRRPSRRPARPAGPRPRRGMRRGRRAGGRGGTRRRRAGRSCPRRRCRV